MAQMQAMAMSIFWYSVGCFERAENLNFQQFQEIAQAASEISSERPLHMMPGTKFTLPHIGEVTSMQVIAWMTSFLVWAQCQIAGHPRELLPDSPFLAASADAWNFWRLTTSLTTEEIWLRSGLAERFDGEHFLNELQQRITTNGKHQP